MEIKIYGGWQGKKHEDIPVDEPSKTIFFTRITKRIITTCLKALTYIRPCIT